MDGFENTFSPASKFCLVGVIQRVKLDEVVDGETMEV